MNAWTLGLRGWGNLGGLLSFGGSEVKQRAPALCDPETVTAQARAPAYRPRGNWTQNSVCFLTNTDQSFYFYHHCIDSTDLNFVPQRCWILKFDWSRVVDWFCPMLIKKSQAVLQKWNTVLLLNLFDFVHHFVSVLIIFLQQHGPKCVMPYVYNAVKL